MRGDISSLVFCEIKAFHSSELVPLGVTFIADLSNTSQPACEMCLHHTFSCSDQCGKLAANAINSVAAYARINWDKATFNSQ